MKPTVRELCDLLRDVIDWEAVVLELPGMNSTEIRRIKRDETSVDLQKQAAFDVWLRRCPEASWSHVRQALNKAREYDVEKIVAEKFNLPPLQTENPPPVERATAQTNPAPSVAAKDGTTQPKPVPQTQTINNPPPPPPGEESTDYGPPPGNQQQPADDDEEEQPDIN